MQPPSPMTRRTFLKKGAWLAGSLLASGGLLGGYSTYVEPRWYDIERFSLFFERLPAAFIGKRLVHISDFHIGHHFGLSQLEVVVKLVRNEKPDILCFTGDLFDSHISEVPEKVSKLLASIEAPLGKWAVLGNHDKVSGKLKTSAILENGGFHTLFNESHKISHGGQIIQLAGVEDMLTGKPDIQKALHGASPEIFTLLLSHSANYADIAAGHSLDLQLSGHSHGGQIRLPIVGALVTPPLGDKYVMGLHTVPGSKLQVYTTRGIGTTSLPFRLLCRPEITVISLEKTKP